MGGSSRDNEVFLQENMREDYKIKKSMIQNYKALIDDLRAAFSSWQENLNLFIFHLTKV